MKSLAHRFISGAACAASMLAGPSMARELAAGQVEIELHAQVQAPRRVVQLGDVAHIRATDFATIQRLLVLPLGEVSRPGDDAVLEREVLAQWIRARAGIEPARLIWRGAQRSVVRTAVQQVSSAQLEEVARASLQRWLRARTTRFGIESAGPVRDLSLPAGDVKLEARALPQGSQPASRMVVWVDVWAGGAFVQTVPVSFAVDAYRQGWVAAVAAAAGAPLDGEALLQREVAMTGRSASSSPLPVSAEAHPMQAARTLRAGETLTAGNTRKVSAVGRGEWVTLQFKSGGLALEGRAESLQDGEPGQVVRVRLAGAASPVEARVVARGRVEATP